MLVVTLWFASARAEWHSLEVTSPANATLSGDLSLPRGQGPFPAVILLHGCAGIGSNIREWSHWLVHEGYATFVLDSFTGRRLRRLCGYPAPLTGPMRAPDVYAAASYLKTLGAIDGRRVAAIGFSHGGWTVLAAAASEDLHPEVALRGFIAFYPGCGGRTGCSHINWRWSSMTRAKASPTSCAVPTSSTTRRARSPCSVYWVRRSCVTCTCPWYSRLTV